MKAKSFLIFTLFLMISLIFTACSLFIPAGTNLMAGVDAAEWPKNPDKPSSDYLQALSNFNWKMAEALDTKTGNIMVSPASVYLALAMTLNGADGQTKTDMLKALSSEGLTLDAVNKASRDWITLLNKDDDKARLRIVNSIWYREDFAADKLFLQKNADFFGAAARSLDFSKDSTVTAINGWVKKATEGSIDKIVNSISSDTVMFLINAIYFNAEWETKFESKNTKNASFAAPDGEKTVKFMNRTGDIEYLKTDDAEGVVLPYSGGKFALLALLPKEGTDPRSLFPLLDSGKLAVMMDGRQSKNITLAMPKFESEFETELEKTLTTLGMGIAFDSSSADFSLMQESRAKDLYISSVTHKTYIRVDELGTEAAAVTKVTISKTSIPIGDITVRFNRPFLYSIIDLDTNLPLFIGIMEKP